MATVNGGTLTISRDSVNVYADGSADIHLFYANAGGTKIHVRVLRVAADGSSVVDNYGNVIAAPAPASLMNAISSFTGTLDTLITSGAAANKLNL